MMVPIPGRETGVRTPGEKEDAVVVAVAVADRGDSGMPASPPDWSLSRDDSREWAMARVTAES